MSDICTHRQDSPLGRLLRSPCRACEYERDPALLDRAVQAWQITEDTRAGRMTADDAERRIRELYA